MNARDRLHRRCVLTSLAAVLLPGCSTPAIAPDDRDFLRLQQARYLVLGEVHDNAEQHRMAAALLTRLLKDGRSTCVVLEQIDRGHDAAIAGAPRDAESVANAGRLDRKAWGWPLHKPVIEAALAGGAGIRGGDLSNDEARAIVRGGPASVRGEAATLLNAAAWTASDESEVEEDIDRGHCGALPPALLPKMALAQRARDATLAQSLLDAGKTHERVVLIAGNGHARTDLGVPRYLAGAGIPKSRIVSVGYLEQADAAAPYDVIRVTPVQPRPDPCLAFANRTSQ